MDDIRREKPNAEEVVTDFYVKLRPSLLAYVYHLVSSSRDAEDLVQVAFLQFFDYLRQEREIQNPRGWLYRVVHNLAIEPHCHVHLVPIDTLQDLDFDRQDRNPDPHALDDAAAKLRAALTALGHAEASA